MNKHSNKTIVYSIIVASLILVAIVLPVCNSYMLEDIKMQHSEQAHCCTVEVLAIGHHISHLKIIYSGLLTQNLLDIVLLFFAMLLAGAMILNYRRYFDSVFNKWKVLLVLFEFSSIHLRSHLRLAYAQGIIQSKHLD